MSGLEEKSIKESKYPLDLEKRELSSLSILTENVGLPGVSKISISKTQSILTALKSDGVGTKILLAEAMKVYNTVGIDAVAMSVNDLVCLGAKPLLLNDYIAQNQDEPEILEKILEGVKKGCELAGAELVGGETATLGNMISGYGNGYHFDLATTAFGIIFGDLITKEKMKEDDKIIGIESSGLHSNGYLWVRPVLLKEFNPNAPYNLYDETETGKEIGELLLEPTYIYVKPLLEIIETLNVKGIAHITGGAYKIKLSRIAPPNISFVLNNIPEPTWIFREIQKHSKATDYRMYEALNMGIGMCLVLNEKECDTAIDIIEKHGFKAKVIGHLKKDNKTKVYIPSKKIVFEKVEKIS